MQVQADMRPNPLSPSRSGVPIATALVSLAAVAAVFVGMSFAFFDGPLDGRVLRNARSGVQPMTVATAMFQEPGVMEGRSAATCNKDAVQNLTTALIDSGQMQQAADALNAVAARCARFR